MKALRIDDARKPTQPCVQLDTQDTLRLLQSVDATILDWIAEIEHCQAHGHQQTADAANLHGTREQLRSVAAKLKRAHSILEQLSSTKIARSR